jgi:GH35 family endo-1,4-beta-xylanase
MRKKFRTLLFENLDSRRLLAVDAAGNGILAQYYNDSDLQSLFVSRLENGLNIDWANGVPSAGMNVDQFSARFSGEVEARFTELHTFTLSAQGGARLWINGILLMDRWSDASFANATATVNMIAGRRYDIQLEFRETGGTASIDLRWSSGSLALQGIPIGNLYASERGSIQRRIWNSVPGNSISSLTGLATYPNGPTTTVAVTNLDLISSGVNQSGELIIGQLHPPATGRYRFYVAADDTAELWLSHSSDPSGKQRIASVTRPTGVQQWAASPSQQSDWMSLVAGQSYSIEVIHKQDSGAAHLSVGWLRPGAETIEAIDGQYLSSPLPKIRVFTKRQSAAEGDAIPIEFVVQRTDGPLTNSLTVKYSVSGTATPGVDYTTLAGTVTIPAGASQASVLVSPLSDLVFERAETVNLTVVDSLGYEVGFPSERQVIGTIQNLSPALNGGNLISPTGSLSNYQRFGGTFAQVSPASPFSSIIQATITSVPANVYDAQLKFAYTAAIKKGDLLWSEFYVRSLTGEGKITAVSERNASPYEKSIERGINVGANWIRVQLPFVSVDAYAPGVATFGFFLGFQLQTLQFADIIVRNYGPARDLTPTTLGLNNIGGTWGNATTVAIAGQTFTSATQITTVTTPPNNETYRLQFGGYNSVPVPSGTSIYFEFYARAISGSTPRVTAVLQRRDNFATLSSQTINLGTAWQKYGIRAVISTDFDVNGLQAMLNVGFAPQTVQFADLKWTNMTALYDIKDLPSLSPAANYLGRNADDPWRLDAEQRVDQVRQSTLTVNVVDANGKPIDGALVSLQQTKHSFLFGSAVDGNGPGGLLSSTGGPDALKYQSEIKRLFNAATIENSLKWPFFEPNRQRGIDAANWVVQNGLWLRGHNIVWPSRSNMPSSVWTNYDSIKNAQGTAAAADYLRQTIHARVQDAISTFSSLASEWDIVNEPYVNNEVMTILGNEIVVDWFKQARQVDPDIQRVLNEYDIFARNGNNTAHRANFDAWLTLLKSNNAIERIGEQSHYNDSNLTDIAVLGQLIQSYQSQFALPIAITEFDVESLDLQLQADYLRDYMTMVFSQSAVDEFIHWGFWSKSHWRPNSALYNDDFSIRPNGQVYEDLVFGKWWSDIQGTSRSGAFVADIFEGNYKIVVSIAGQSITRDLLNINVDGSITVQIPIVQNSSPVMTPASFNIAENPNVGNVIGMVSASDADAGQALTYSIVGGNTNNAFAIDSVTGQVTVANAGPVDYETNSLFYLMVRVSDNGVTPMIDQIIVPIAVSNVDDAVITNGNFYHKGSSFAASGTNVTAALDPGKVLAKAGPAPVLLSFANLINTTRGINGVTMEVVGIGNTSLTASDFVFRMSPTGLFNESNNPPSSWSTAPSPSAINVSTLSGNVARIVLEWTDNEIANRWLQVQVLANSRTGLPAPAVYYLGHLQGEVNGTVTGGAFFVTTQDQSAVLPLGTATVGNVRDLDKNSFVTTQDLTAVRNSITAGRTLRVITIPADGSSAEGMNATAQTLSNSLLAPALTAEASRIPTWNRANPEVYLRLIDELILELSSFKSSDLRVSVDTSTAKGNWVPVDTWNRSLPTQQSDDSSSSREAGSTEK